MPPAADSEPGFSKDFLVILMFPKVNEACDGDIVMRIKRQSKPDTLNGTTKNKENKRKTRKEKMR